MEGLCFGGLEGEGDASLSGMEKMDPPKSLVSSPLPVSNAMAEPIRIPSAKQEGVARLGVSHGDLLYSPGMDRSGMSN